VRSVAERCGETFPFALLAIQPRKRGDFSGITKGSTSTIPQPNPVFRRQAADLGQCSGMTPEPGI
jgi:hypothetical protein